FSADTPPTQIYTLSLHDALPIFRRVRDIYFWRRISHSDRCDLPNDDVGRHRTMRPDGQFQKIRHLAQLHASSTGRRTDQPAGDEDRKSTRLNSSHVKISYAVFCL